MSALRRDVDNQIPLTTTAIPRRRPEPLQPHAFNRLLRVATLIENDAWRVLRTAQGNIESRQSCP